MGSLEHGTSVDKKQGKDESVISKLNELETNWYDEMERIRNKEKEEVNDKNQKEIEEMKNEIEEVNEIEHRSRLNQNENGKYRQGYKVENYNEQNSRTNLDNDKHNQIKENNKMKISAKELAKQCNLTRNDTVNELELGGHTTNVEDYKYNIMKNKGKKRTSKNTVDPYNLVVCNTEYELELDNDKQQTNVQCRQRHNMREIDDKPKQSGKIKEYRKKIGKTGEQPNVNSNKKKEDSEVNIYSKIFSQYQKEQDTRNEIMDNEKEMTEDIEQGTDIIQWLQDIRINRKVEYTVKQLDDNNNGNKKCCSTLNRNDKETTSTDSEYERET